MENDRHQQLDLERLRARLREKPRTKVGQVRQAWPYIKELLAAGHSLKDIWAWLNEIGIEIGYARLSHYVGQLRRAELTQVVAKDAESPAVGESPFPVVSETPAAEPEEPRPDPLANLARHEQKRPGFHYNSDADPKKLI